MNYTIVCDDNGEQKTITAHDLAVYSREYADTIDTMLNEILDKRSELEKEEMPKGFTNEDR
jgi:hypothetical protein